MAGSSGDEGERHNSVTRLYSWDMPNHHDDVSGSKRKKRKASSTHPKSVVSLFDLFWVFPHLRR